MAGKIRKTVIMALILSLCLVCLPGVQQVQAGTNAKVTFTYEGMKNCSIKMYYVADYSESTGYRLASSFANTSMSRDDIESGNWYSLAMTLETLVIGNSISAYRTGKTNANGKVTFSNMAEGMYLVTISRMTVDNTVYTAQPLLIMVPEYGSDGTKNYNQSITITKYETSEAEEKTSVSVQKVWDDDDSSSRPESVTVYLLNSEGNAEDSRVLSSSNNWRYTWSDLDGSEVWYVIEEDMDEYGVSYSSADDGTIVITNQQGTGKTHGMETIPPDEEELIINGADDSESAEGTESTESVSTEEGTEGDVDNSDDYLDGDDMVYQDYDETEYIEDYTDEDNEEDSQPTGSSGSSGSSGTSSSSTQTTRTGDKLPQTGAGWGAALFLLAAALGCFLIGTVRGTARRQKEEQGV